MNMNRGHTASWWHPFQCPECKIKIFPLRIFALTRWTFIRCKHCGASIQRKTDFQFSLITIIYLIPSLFILNHITPLFLKILLTVVWLTIVAFIDVHTLNFAVLKKGDPRKIDNAPL